MNRNRFRWVGLALVVAAIAQELRKPAGERTWNGRLFGTVPYDFRPPSLQRIKERIWNPHDDRIFTPQTFGVGWSVNLYRVKELLFR